MQARCFGRLAREARMAYCFSEVKVSSLQRRMMATRAAADPPSEPSFEVSSSTKPPAETPTTTAIEAGMSAADIKAALLDSLYGTDRGLTASSEVRAEINELITQLEAKNPTPGPAEDEKLNGMWKLAYTSAPTLMTVLTIGKLPGVEVQDITQSISIDTQTLENRVPLQIGLAGPMARTAVSTAASIESRSPMRLQLKLSKGVLERPEIVESDLAELPQKVSLMGTELDLTQFQSVLNPLRENFMEAAKQISVLLQNQPDLSVPVENEQATTWLLITYLDDSMRVTRGDGGSVFVFTREVSPPEVVPEVTIDDE